MKDLKEIKHVDEIRTASIEQVKHWIKQCNWSRAMTMTELLDRLYELKHNVKL